jgi:serine/threonine protein phosphatase PrpC
VLIAVDEASHRFTSHRWRHAITNAVCGSTAGVDVELHKLVVSRGDRLLLCKDELTTWWTTARFPPCSELRRTPKQPAAGSSTYRNDRGGRDNITVSCVREEHGGWRFTALL